MRWSNPNLIQRLSPPTGVAPSFRHTTGDPLLSSAQEIALGRLFHFEYMGAAEYEWEQVPHAILTLTESLPDLCEGQYREHGRKEVFFLVHRRCEEDLFNWIWNHLRHGMVEPKDPTMMDLATNGTPDIKTCGWLALGACPWIATTNKEDILRFKEFMRKHRSASFATV